MRKIVKIWLLVLIFCLSLNVYAEPVNENQTNTTSQTVTTNEDDENQQETGEENKNENQNQTQEVVGTKSNVATLDEIYINEEKVVCDKFVCSKIIKDNSVTEVLITYKTTDSKATVSKKEIKEKLVEGENTFKVEVVAEDLKTKQEYTFKITKEVLSTDSSLKKLVLNGEEIKLEKDTTKYKADVSFSTKKIEIEAETNHEKATIEDFKNNKASFDFFDTSEDFKIKVLSEAGDMTTYTITVTRRDEKDATLKSLKIKNASIDFESGVLDYETSVLRSVETLEIEAEPTDKEATVKIDKPKTLEIGENTVKIKVTNDGNEKTYVIKVTRLNEDKSLANLESLEIEGYEIDFKEDKYEYDLKIKDENYLVIEALAKAEEAEVEILGNLDLVNGSIIKIKVNYDEENANVYKINIIKEEIKEKEDNKLVLIIIISSIALVLVAVLVIVIIVVKKKKAKQAEILRDDYKKEENIVLEKPNKKDIITLEEDDIEEII